MASRDQYRRLRRVAARWAPKKLCDALALAAGELHSFFDHTVSSLRVILDKSGAYRVLAASSSPRQSLEAPPRPYSPLVSLNKASPGSPRDIGAKVPGRNRTDTGISDQDRALPWDHRNVRSRFGDRRFAEPVRPKPAPPFDPVESSFYFVYALSYSRFISSVTPYEKTDVFEPNRHAVRLSGLGLEVQADWFVWQQIVGGSTLLGDPSIGDVKTAEFIRAESG